MMKLNLQLAAIAATLMATLVIAMPPVQAQQRFKVNTSSGVLGGSKAVGPNGGTAGCVYGARYGSAGGRACGVNGQNGYAYGSTGVDSGVGAYRKFGRTYTNPTTGNTVSSSSSNVYNAETDKGSRSVSRGATVGGTAYGYDKNKTYTYTPGIGYSGSTTIQTENNGAYSCSYVSGATRTCTKP